MSEPVDLFGRSAGPEQLSMFGDEGERTAAPDFAPDPAVIRHRLGALLTRAREASSMPWPERDARMWQTVFPQMADWLPAAEADQLRLAFAEEIERLKAA